MSEIAEEQTTEETTNDESATDLVAEVEKWKALSRKNEQQAKANAQAAKELEEFRRANQTDQERLIEATKEETRLAIRQEYAGKLVEAELKSALAGKVLEGNALLSFDKNAFIDANGDIDTPAITAWVEAHTTTTAPAVPDLGQGPRGSKNSSLSSAEKFAQWAKDVL